MHHAAFFPFQPEYSASYCLFSCTVFVKLLNNLVVWLFRWSAQNQTESVHLPTLFPSLLPSLPLSRGYVVLGIEQGQLHAKPAFGLLTYAPLSTVYLPCVLLLCISYHLSRMTGFLDVVQASVAKKKKIRFLTCDSHNYISSCNLWLNSRL